MVFQEYDLTIEYNKGKENYVADALSRAKINATIQSRPHQHDIGKLQRQDPLLDGLGRYLNNNQVPEDATPDIKTFIRRQGRKFTLKQNKIYRKGPINNQLVLPNALRTQILLENHDAPLAGHLGTEKTLA